MPKKNKSLSSLQQLRNLTNALAEDASLEEEVLANSQRAKRLRAKLIRFAKQAKPRSTYTGPGSDTPKDGNVTAISPLVVSSSGNTELRAARDTKQIRAITPTPKTPKT